MALFAVLCSMAHERRGEKSIAVVVIGSKAHSLTHFGSLNSSSSSSSSFINLTIPFSAVWINALFLIVYMNDIQSFEARIEYACNFVECLLLQINVFHSFQKLLQFSWLKGHLNTNAAEHKWFEFYQIIRRYYIQNFWFLVHFQFVKNFVEK